MKPPVITIEDGVKVPPEDWRFGNYKFGLYIRLGASYVCGGFDTPNQFLEVLSAAALELKKAHKKSREAVG